MSEPTTNDAWSFVLAGLITFLFAWSYSYDKRRLGDNLTRKLTPRLIVKHIIWLVGILEFSSVMQKALENIAENIFIVIAIAATLWTIIAKALFRGKPNSPLRNFGIVDQLPTYSIVVFLAIALIALKDYRTYCFTFAGMLLLLAIMIIASRERTFIAEDGLYAPSTKYKWGQIKQYAFSDNKDDMITLVLFLTGRIAPYDFEEVKVPANQREYIDQVFAEHQISKF